MHAHHSSIIGFIVTSVTANVAAFDPDPDRSAVMFALSLVIAILTIAHLILQIRDHLRHRRRRVDTPRSA